MKKRLLITLFLSLLVLGSFLFPDLYYRERDEEFAEEHIQNALETKYGESFHVNVSSIFGDGEVEANMFPPEYDNPDIYGTRAAPYFRGSAEFDIYPFGFAGRVDDNWDKIQLRLEREQLYHEKVSNLFSGNIIVRENSRLREGRSTYTLFEAGREDILDGSIQKEVAAEETDRLQTTLDIYIFQTPGNEEEITANQKNIYKFVEFLRENDLFANAELNFYFMDKRMLTPGFNRYNSYLEKAAIEMNELEDTVIRQRQEKSRQKISDVLQAELNEMSAAEIEQEIEKLRKTVLDYDDLRVNCQYEVEIIPLSWLENSPYIRHQRYYDRVKERDALDEHIYDHWSKIDIKENYAYSFLEVEEPTMVEFFEGGSQEDKEQLMEAISQDEWEIVYEYVHSDMNLNFVDDEGYTPLMRAVDEENFGAVRQLVGSGRIYDLTTPLEMVIEDERMTAFSDSDIDRMDYFEEILKGEPEMGSAILLLRARQSGTPAMERELIKAGAKVDIRMGDGFTPLMSAINNNDLEEAELLLRAGADINHQDDDGYTSLMYAVMNENPEVVSLLLDAGADVNLKNDDNKQALMLVDDDEDQETTSKIIEMLIEAGASIDARDNEGRTSLMDEQG